VGIFAQRGKNRPNRPGATICTVLGVDGREIAVRGLDAIDGTPVVETSSRIYASSAPAATCASPTGQRNSWRATGIDLAMRELDGIELAEQLDWLSGGTWPSTDGATGYDRADGYAASAWVLNAVYERTDMPENLTHHEVHQLEIDAGLAAPAMVGDFNLDTHTITTGVGLGFAGAPEAPWRRLRWAELGRRDGFGFWAVDGKWPDLRYTRHPDWTDPAVMPFGSVPRIGPTTQMSWPISLLPPAEGSLDAASLLALIEVLSRHTTPEALQNCGCYYGAVALGGDVIVYAGDLHDLPALVRSQRGTQLTPNNIWPGDRCWLVYADYDLRASRVSGSPQLVDALCDDSDLDTIRCG
jgi:hypothetical protein